MKYQTLKYNKMNMIEADNESGLKIIVTPVGASIRSINFNGVEMLNIPKNDNEFFSKESTLGKTLGPILNNKNNYEICGKAYSFNEEYTLNNVLFAGTPFLDKKYFSMAYSYKKKPMKDGLPANVQYYVSYTMATGRNEILIDYRVISDKQMPVSISNNIQFGLGVEHLSNLTILLPKEKKKRLSQSNIDNLFNIYNKDLISLESPATTLEIKSDYEVAHLKANPETDSFSLTLLDDQSKEKMIDKSTIYHHQILYKFNLK